ncbi:30S ribosomal protein S8 [Candidatus Daviesbacteria bacterium]|nr:30S ribosomal protein S8 [Candidatus Daviesbacteria bacterium]
MIRDSVSDALIRIKNGYKALKPEIILTYSKLIIAILKVLEKEGYVVSFKEQKDKQTGFISVLVTLKYDNQQKSAVSVSKKIAALTDVKRISKPGLRIYKNSKQLPWVLNGLGIALISTPKGVMTDKQARKENLGGEILAYVW